MSPHNNNINIDLYLHGMAINRLQDCLFNSKPLSILVPHFRVKKLKQKFQNQFQLL